MAANKETKKKAKKVVRYTNKANNIVIFDDYTYLDNEYFEETKAELIAVNEDGAIPSDDEVYSEIRFMRETDYDEIMYSLKAAEKALFTTHNPLYLVLGTLGLWDGTHDGGKIIQGGFEKVYQACAQDFTTLGFSKGVCYISAVHHDGTNYFRVKELTAKGIDYIINHPYDFEPRELHRRLWNDAHYTIAPRCFEKAGLRYKPIYK